MNPFKPPSPPVGSKPDCPCTNKPLSPRAPRPSPSSSPPRPTKRLMAGRMLGIARRQLQKTTHPHEANPLYINRSIPTQQARAEASPRARGYVDLRITATIPTSRLPRQLRQPPTPRRHRSQATAHDGLRRRRGRTVGRDDEGAAAIRGADGVLATSFVDSDLRLDKPCCRSSSRLNLASSSSDSFLSTGARSARSIAGQGSKGPRTNRPRGSSANTCFRTRASSSVTSSSSSS